MFMLTHAAIAERVGVAVYVTVCKMSFIQFHSHKNNGESSNDDSRDASITTLKVPVISQMQKKTRKVMYLDEPSQQVLRDGDVMQPAANF